MDVPVRLSDRPMQIEIVAGDITDQRTDAIVNAANSGLLGGGGVDGAIHRVGGPAVLAACRVLRSTSLPDGLPPGQAVATEAGDLPARWVIHTVGPVYSAAQDKSATLRSCYTESLRVADALNAGSVAFPLISAGVYGWPKSDAVEQALTALVHASTNVQVSRLVLFDPSLVEAASLALTTIQNS
jgi:O-acetyl-ADP-ribose deacetylase (regulator of RNase III)